jgi:hypothetical protein
LEKRLSLTSTGNIRYRLKTAYREACPMNVVNTFGMARHMWLFSNIHALLDIRTSMNLIFEPPHFIAKLASLVPKPRVNFTRFHGVFVVMPHHLNSQYRLTVTPAKQGQGKQR